MGSFFTNLHVRAAAPDRAVEALRRAGGLPAYVTESDEGWVSLYPEATESQDLAALERIATAVSTGAGAPVYASLVHDSDVWNFLVAAGGRVVDRYCSNPGYFSGARRKPSGGKSALLLPLCRAGTAAAELEDLLRRHLTVGQPLPQELSSRLAEEMERQKEFLAGNYEQMKAGLTALGAKMPSLSTMQRRVERKVRKLVSGAGRAESAEDLAQAFARMLGIQDARGVLGYAYIKRGEAPEGLARLVPA